MYENRIVNIVNELHEELNIPKLDIATILVPILQEERKKLEDCVCRLYDVQLITAEKACELLGMKTQEFQSIYRTWPRPQHIFT
jgi:cobalamin biosynthesis protein CbiG